MPYTDSAEEGYRYPGPSPLVGILLVVAALALIVLIGCHPTKEQPKELPRRPDVNPNILREVQRESDETQMIMIYGAIF